MNSRIIKTIIAIGVAYLASGFSTFLNDRHMLFGSYNQAAFAITAMIVVVVFRKDLLESINDRWNWLPLLLVVVYGSISGFFFSNDYLSESDMVWAFNMLVRPYLLYLIIMVTCKRREEFMRCMSLIYGFVFMTLVLYYFKLSSLGVNLMEISGKRVNPETYGLILNYNTVSYMATVLVLVTMRLVELAPVGKKIYYSMLHWATLGIALWVCIFNQSRAPMVFVLALGLWSAFTIFKKNQFSTNVAVVFSLFFLALSVAYFIDISDIGEPKIVERFRHPERSSDIERQVMMNESFHYFLKSPIFGNDSVAKVPGVNSNDHNYYSLILSRYGLVGAILFATYLISIVRGIRLESSPAQKFGMAFIFYYLVFTPPYPFLAIAFVITRYPVTKGSRNRVMSERHMLKTT